jgi:hypothetical protein
VSRALDACGRKLDGTAASPEYYRHRRTFYAALKHAVREGQLPANPLDGAEDPEAQKTRNGRRPRSPTSWTGGRSPARPR